MDIYKVRRNRLRQLIDENYGGKQAQFARAMGIKAPQISRWLSESAGESRDMTEESARAIETKANKPRGWMDCEAHAESVTEIEAIYNALDDNMKALMLEQMRAFARMHKK